MAPDSFELPEIDSIAALLPAFEFDCLIAQGGMGAVYKARQRSLDRDVAIKILPRELGEDPHFRSSFQDEAKSMARLAHPSLIGVYDFGDLDGLLYIVMEYVPGKSLFHSAHGKAIDSRQAVGIVLAACRGLAHAHENGIVHRDIKPGNILLTPKCEPKIGDFGLARCLRTDVDGLAMGTPAYMAPEVLDHPERGNPQSDVFAIGVVLQEMLTGIPAGTDQAAFSVISDPMLAAICRKATHPDPASRFPDAASLAGHLARWMAPKTPGALAPVRQIRNPQPKPYRMARQHAAAGRSSAFRNLAGVSVLLLASYFAWGTYQRKHGVVVRHQLEQKARPSMQMAKAD